MKFEAVDFSAYNKPPYLPQTYARGETKKLVSFDDAQYEEIDRLIRQASNQYDLEKVKGILLDRIGKILDEKRDANDDKMYRILLQLRILLNTTKGTVNDIIKVVKFFYSSEVVHIVPNYPAGISILHDGEGPSLNFNRIIEQVVGAGIAYDTKELFDYSDAVALFDEPHIQVGRDDIDFFRKPLKFNGAVKFDGVTRNDYVSAYGKFDGKFKFDGKLKFSGIGKAIAILEHQPVPPFKFGAKSAILDVLEYTVNGGHEVDSPKARLCFDGSVKFSGGSKFNAISQYSINDSSIPITERKNLEDQADPIIETTETAVVKSVEDNTKKVNKFDGRSKFNGRTQFAIDYVDRAVMGMPSSGNPSDNVNVGEADFVIGMRKHHKFNGAYKFDGSIKFDSSALIPLG